VTLWLTGTDPVPANNSWIGELEALLTKDALPVAPPLAFGVNDKVNDALCPGARVRGKDSPLTLNSELVMLPEFTVTVAPVAVSVAGMLLLAPTVTVPKLADVGVTDNCPDAEAPPLRGMLTPLSKFVSLIQMLPVEVPLPGGVNVTVKVKLCPGLRLTGGVSPLIPNPVPVTVACRMVTDALLKLVTATDWLCLVPTGTLPKLILAGFATNPGVPVPETLRT